MLVAKTNGSDTYSPTPVNETVCIECFWLLWLSAVIVFLVCAALTCVKYTRRNRGIRLQSVDEQDEYEYIPTGSRDPVVDVR